MTHSNNNTKRLVHSNKEKRSFKPHLTAFFILLIILVVILFYLAVSTNILGASITKLLSRPVISHINTTNLTINKTNVTIPPPAVYSATFKESGLPTGILWHVSYDSNKFYSNTNTDFVTSDSRSISFQINNVSVNGCVFIPSEFGGIVRAGNTVEIFFKSECTTYFNEQYLPADENWSVTYGGVTKYSVNNSLKFTGSYGVFTFRVSNVSDHACKSSPFPAGGSLQAGTNKTIFFITPCTVKTNKVVFLENGLPTGIEWNVSYDNMDNASASGSISFIPSPANFTSNFTVSKVSLGNCLFTPDPAAGSAAPGSIIPINFSSSCLTGFYEEGLPVNETWQVNYDSSSLYNKSPDNISFFVGLGSFPFSVNNVVVNNCTYYPSSNASSPLSSGSRITVVFTPACISTFHERGLPAGLEWSVAYDGIILNSASSSITFSTAPGNFSFNVFNSTRGGCIYSPAPSSGNLSASATATIAFSKVCHTDFASSGLPQGISWEVEYDNQTRDGSYNSTIEFPYYPNTVFSYNVSTIIIGNCTYTPYPANGSITAGALQNIHFSGACSTEFFESGLPSNDNWSVTYDGKTRSTLSNTMFFHTVNGSYSFNASSVLSGGGCYYVPSPSSGSAAAGGNESILYVNECVTAFIDPGLPQGANWSVTYNGIKKNSVTQNISFLMQPGKYYYQISTADYKNCFYEPNVTSGSILVGHPVHVSFSLTSCDTIFTEKDLPAGASWQAALNGSTTDSQSNKIQFTSVPGSYSFSVPKLSIGNCVFSPENGSGAVQAGANVSENFSSSCITAFKESGLPSSMDWTAYFAGQNKSSSSNSISFTSLYGNYSYSVAEVPAGGTCHYYPQPLSGNDTAGVTVNLNFIKECTTTFVENGLYSGTLWSVTYNGATVSSNSNKLSILQIPGNYSFKLYNEHGHNCNFAPLTKSRNTTSGSSVNVSFTPTTCTTYLTERGLPENQDWNATFNYTNSSGTNETSFVTNAGNFSLAVPAVNVSNCIFSTSYPSVVKAGSSIGLHFSATCYSNISEKGLPGTKWYFDLKPYLVNGNYVYQGNNLSTNSSHVEWISQNESRSFSVPGIPITSSCSFVPAPSSGGIAAGQNLKITFSDDCITTFRESGLPSGALWTVKYNGLNGTSSSNILTFTALNGQYNFSSYNVFSNGCNYVPNMTRGTVGSGSSLTIEFAPDYCITTFKENNLPQSYPWNVTYNGSFSKSTSNSISFNTSFSPSSFSYLILPKNISVSGCNINLTSNSGLAKIGSTVNIVYNNFCATYFNETGLPSSTKWSVDFNGITNSSSGSKIIILASPGSHTYYPSIVSVGSGCYYQPDTTKGSLSAGSSVAISYTLECNTTFMQQSLPSGALWNITYNGVTKKSSNQNITFVTSNSSYSFSSYSSIYSGCSYLPSPPSGTLKAGSSEAITFTENTCNTTFIESGLPSGTKWNLTYDGIQLSTSSRNVSVVTPAGIFKLSVANVKIGGCTYYSSPSSGSTVTGSLQKIHFSAKCYTTFNETGLPLNTTWSITYNGIATSSNTNSIKVPSLNGTYVFSASYVGNSTCYYQPSPSSGGLAAGSSKIINYSGGCTTNFIENGLPKSSKWNVVYDGINETSNSSEISFITPPGKFAYSISNLTIDNCFYTVTTNSTAAAGSNIYLVFNQTRCTSYFKESGLPKNINFTLSYNGANKTENDSTGNLISFVTSPGTFNFTAYTIKSGNCLFTPSPLSGHLSAGTSITIGYSALCNTYFNETGLPSGTTWKVTYDGITNFSSTSSLLISSIYSNFSFTVSSIQVSANCYLDPTPSSGSILAGSNKSITFASTCFTGFTETGLPSGTTWTVTYDGIDNSSSQSTILFNVPPGNYSFLVPAVNNSNCFYYSNSSSGYLVSGNYTQLKFTEKYCITTFKESGLPSSTKWNVTFAGVSNSSTTSTIAINSSKGTYSFTVPDQTVNGCVYTPSPQSGNISADSIISVSFSHSYCITTFRETGLPSETTWSAEYNSQSNSSNTTVLSFNTTYGTFTFSTNTIKQGQCTFTPSITKENFTSGSSVNITFSSICYSYFKEAGLPQGYKWEAEFGGKNGLSVNNTLKFITSYSSNYTLVVYPVVKYNSGFVSNVSRTYLPAGSNLTVAFSNDTSAYEKPFVLPVSFYNSQNISTSQPFQQMLSFNSSKYSGYENSRLSNIMFTYQNGSVIPSWLESGNSNRSNNTVYWLKIKSIPSKSGITIYMIFNRTLLQYANNFNNKTTGEAPQLSATYAEYDDGANVFNFYDNFAGTSLNTTKWNSYGSDQTSGSLSGISVNNSLSLTGGGTGGLSHETWIADTNIQWNSNIILDVYEDSPSASTTFRWGMTNTVPGTYFGGNPAFGIQVYKDGNWYTNAYSSAGIQNKIGSYPTNTYNIYSISATESRIIYYLNSYSSAPNAGQTITTNIPAFSSTIFLALTNEYTNPIYVRWVRTRAYPPVGVMPSIDINTTLVTTYLNETGLPQGYNWYALFNGINKSATSNSIMFSTVSGRYNLSVPVLSNVSSTLNCTSTYTPNITQAEENAGTNINIHFSLSDICTTSFVQNGLAPNSLWSVSFDGKNVSSVSSAIPGAVPAYIKYYRVIKIHNSQGVSTVSPLQQVVNLSHSIYAGLAASNFQNVEFFYQNGTIIPSWLANYIYSKYSVYWLNPGSIPANSSINIYIGFASNSTVVLAKLSNSTSIDLGPYPQPSTGSQLPAELSENYTSCGNFFNMEYGGNLNMICSWGGGDVNIYMAGGNGGYSGLSITGASNGVSYYNHFFNTPYCLSSYGSIYLPPGEYKLATSRGNGGGGCGPGGFILTAPTLPISYPNGVMPKVTFILPNGTITVPDTPFGNYTATASTNSSCSTQSKYVQAGSISFFIGWNCTNKFIENNLPNNITWWVDYNGVNRSNITPKNISITSLSSGSGIYSYKAGFSKGYSLGMTKAGVSTNISLWNYTPSFNETGLPSNTAWKVIYNGKTHTSDINVIHFTDLLGNYSFSLPDNITTSTAVYIPNITKGYMESNGSLAISFSKKSLATPVSVYKYQVLNITNPETISTAQPFQQMINLTITSANSKYINQSGAHSLQNLEFFNTTTGKPINSWLESYHISSGTGYAIYWIKLPNGIQANTTLFDIAVGFASNSTDLFNNKTRGEAPQLSSTYGEYNDIGNVMNSGLQYQIYYDSGGACDSGSYQNNVYSATLNDGVTISSCASMVSSTIPFYTALSGSSKDVDGTTKSNVVINYQEGYSGGAAYPNPPVSNTGNSWIIKAIGWAEVNSATTFYVGSDDGIALGYSTTAGQGNGAYWLGGTSNPNNLVSQWHTEPFTAYSGVESSLGTVRIEMDYYEDGGGAYTALWSNNAVSYYSPTAPPDGIIPSVKFNNLVTNPINLFINGLSNNNVTAIYGQTSNFTVESNNNYVKLWDIINNSVTSLTSFSRNISTYASSPSIGKIRVIGGSNSSSINNISYYETINKAVPSLSLTSKPGVNYTYNGTNLTVTAAISTINSQVTATLYINGVLNKTITTTTTINLGKYANNYTIVLNTSGNANYTSNSVTIKRVINPSLSTLLDYYLPINITNVQSTATPAPFQELVNLSYSNYKQYINLSSGHQFQNVVFYNKTSDKKINSWLENYTSKYALFWIKLPDGIPANTTITNIVIGLVHNSTDLFNNKTTGEAPQLSPTYAEYDDGANVFNFYDNFAGTTLKAGWNSGPSGVTVAVNNGVTITPGGTAGSFAYDGITYSNQTFSAPFIAESLGDIINSTNMVMIGGSNYITPSATSDQFDVNAWANSRGGWYYNGKVALLNGAQNVSTNGTYIAQVIIKNTSSITASILTTTYSVDNNMTASETNYNNPVFYLTLGNPGPGSPNNIIHANWVRVRAYPPSGVMPSISFGQAVIPASVENYAKIAINNSQSAATPQPFQQMINMTSSAYKGYAAPNFQNIEFFYPNGTLIPSWLENYSYSKNALYWIKTGSIPASSSITIYIGFASNSTNLFNNKTTGEAPTLSPNYGEYDDGANVFNFYDNFAGTSLNTTKWNSGNSGGTLTIDNGLTEVVPYNAAAGSYVYLSSASYTVSGAQILESYANTNSFDTTNFRIVPDALTALNNTAWHADNGENENAVGWAGNVQAHSTITAETTTTSAANYFDTSQITSDSNYHIFGVLYPDNGSTSVQYGYTNWGSTTTDVPATPLYVTVSYYLNPAQTTFSTSYNLNVYWVRTRAYPPAGVMPSVTFSSVS